MKRKRDEKAPEEKPAKRAKQRIGLCALPAVLQQLAATFLDLSDHQMLALCSKGLESICARGASLAETINLRGFVFVDACSSTGFLKKLKQLAQCHPRKKIIMDLDMAWRVRDLNLPVDQIIVLEEDYRDEKDGDGKGHTRLVNQLTEWQPKYPVRVLEWDRDLDTKTVGQALRQPAFRNIEELILSLSADWEPFELSTLTGLGRLATLHLELDFNGLYQLDALTKMPSLTALHLKVCSQYLPPELHRLPVVSLVCPITAFTAEYVRGPISCSSLTVTTDGPLLAICEKFNALMPQLRSLDVRCTDVLRRSHSSSFFWLRYLHDLKLESLAIRLPGRLSSDECIYFPRNLRSLELHCAEIKHLDHLHQLEDLTLARCSISNLKRLSAGLAPTVKKVLLIECTQPITNDHLPKGWSCPRSS